MSTEQTNNTFGTTSTSTSEAVASTGNQSHAQSVVAQETTVNQPVQTAETTTTTGYQPGPDQVLAQYRRDLEASQKEANDAKALLADPEVAKFLAFQKEQKAKAEADKFGTSPELLNEINTLKAQQSAMVERQEAAQAQAGFANFAETQKMPENVQQEFLGYLETILPPAFQEAALKPGFNFEPYVHAFAATRGANKAAADTANANSVTYVPGQPSSNGATTDAAKMKEYIQNLVKKG